MHQSLLTKISLVVTVLTLVAAYPVHAQQYRGSGNTRIATIGDLARGKLKSQTYLSFSTLGLFGDAEAYLVYEPPNPFSFPMPDLSSKGYDFSDVAYEDYLQLLASAYRTPDTDTYTQMFIAQNAYSLNTGDPLFYAYNDLVNMTYDVNLYNDYVEAIQDYDGYLQYGFSYFSYYYPDENPYEHYFQLLSDLEGYAFDIVHKFDFINGGGYFPLEDDPINPDDLFDPLDPPYIPDPDYTPITPVTSSQSETTSAVVPEPATLGLVAFGLGGVLIRRR